MSINRRLSLLCALLVGALSFTGCANMTTTAANPTQNFAITGIVHGGRQPVVGATVKRMAAGNGGYGTTATLIDSVPSGAGGSFSFSNAYSCPSTTSSTESQYLYITASGGTPTTGVSNSQAAFMIALGPCSTVLSGNPSIIINELTTVASITALQQFFTPDTVNGLGNISTSPTNITGLANAMAVVPNMVNLASGMSFPSTTVSAAVAGFSTSPVVTITPEQLKLNTMADILAACVNTGGSSSSSPNACNTLYANSGGSPLDTLQAAYYMATNALGTGTPTTCSTGTAVVTAPSICTLYGLATASSPFQSTLASAPTDWTLGITYGSTSATTAGVFLLGAPENLAVDSGGNVWIANYSSSNGSLTELSNTGAPVANVLNSNNIKYPIGIVIDPSNNVYVSNYGTSSSLTNTVVEYTAGGSSKSFTVTAGPGQMVSDKTGDIFIIETSASGGGANLEEISSTGTVSNIGALTASKYSGIAMDQYYNIWVGGGGNTTNITPFVYSAPSGTPTWTLGTPATTSCIVSSEGAAVDSNGNLWFPNYISKGGSICEVYSSSTGTVSGPATAYTGGGLYDLGHIVVDGASNLWLSNQATTIEGVSEFTNGGTALSPALEPNATTPTSGGFAHNYDEPFFMAVDASGNVWSGNYDSTATSTTPGYITEIVGAAVPTITPIAAGLPSTAGGTMRIGTKP